MNIEMLARCLLDHPTLGYRKKQILVINATSYFENVVGDTPIAQVARMINCSDELAQRYKNQFLQINWNDTSLENKTKIDKLIDIMSDIMDWQWNPANANRQRNAADRIRIFRPTPTQMAFIREQQPRPRLNLLQLLIKNAPLILFALYIYWQFQQGNDHKPATRFGARRG
jgi:hypothetical protein